MTEKKSFEQIAAEIHSDNSPVGIDAKKTHILILQALYDLQDRMARMEERLGKLEQK